MTPEALDALVASGATVEMIAAAWKAEMVARDDRSPSAKRQSRYRQRVTERNEASQSVTRDEKVSSLEVFPQTPFPNPNFENLPPIVPQNGFDLNGHSGEPEAEPPVTPDELLEAWNETADQCGLPKARMTPERRRLIASRIRQHSIDDIRLALGAIARARWMHGENDKNWRANLKFFLRPGIITELSEGTYDRTH